MRGLIVSTVRSSIKIFEDFVSVYRGIGFVGLGGVSSCAGVVVSFS